MTLVVISPSPVLRFEDANGIPLSGGLLFTYAGGTTNKTPTYTDSTGQTPNTNPIVLNAQGQAPSAIFIPPTTNIKFVLAPKGDADPPTAPIWTVDNVAAGTTSAGTMSLQDASDVSITGGTVSVGTLSVSGATQLSTLAVSLSADFESAVNVDGALTIGGAATFSGPVTINANVTVNASLFSFGSTVGSASIRVQSLTAGFGATVLLQTGTGSRWAFYKNTTAESGSNTGSDLQIDSYTDAGTLLATAIKITRSTGLVTLGSLLITAAGGLTFSGQSNGAGSGAGTLTNAPHAANPSFWLPITVNGAAVLIPCWAA